MISPPVAESRLPVGSSARSSRGLWTRARAMAARCRSPPDSSDGRCRARSPRPSSLRIARACALRGPVERPAGQGRRDHRRQERVLQDRQVGHEIVELEDEADGVPALLVAPALRSCGGVFALEHDLALGRPVQEAHEVQEGALAAPRRAEDAEELAPFDVEIHAVEDAKRGGAHAVVLHQAAGREDRLTHSAGPPRAASWRRATLPPGSPGSPARAPRGTPPRRTPARGAAGCGRSSTSPAGTRSRGTRR